MVMIKEDHVLQSLFYNNNLCVSIRGRKAGEGEKLMSSKQRSKDTKMMLPTTTTSRFLVLLFWWCIVVAADASPSAVCSLQRTLTCTSQSQTISSSGSITINKSSSNTLCCTLLEVTSTYSIKPVAQSYDGNDWEVSATYW